jgi:hypothetical protein
LIRGDWSPQLLPALYAIIVLYLIDQVRLWVVGGAAAAVAEMIAAYCLIWFPRLLRGRRRSESRWGAAILRSGKG